MNRLFACLAIGLVSVGVQYSTQISKTEDGELKKFGQSIEKMQEEEFYSSYLGDWEVVAVIGQTINLPNKKTVFTITKDSFSDSSNEQHSPISWEENEKHVRINFTTRTEMEGEPSPVAIMKHENGKAIIKIATAFYGEPSFDPPNQSEMISTEVFVLTRVDDD